LFCYNTESELGFAIAPVLTLKGKGECVMFARMLTLRMSFRKAGTLKANAMFIAPEIKRAGLSALAPNMRW